MAFAFVLQMKCEQKIALETNLFYFAYLAGNKRWL